MLRIQTGEDFGEGLEGKMTEMAIDVRDTGSRLCFDAPIYEVMSVEAFRNELTSLKARIDDFLVEIEDEGEWVINLISFFLI